MADQLKLKCPIRGVLSTPAKSADGLRPSEEARRIEAIRFLLDRGYPKDHIKVEATIKRFGHKGKNSFRADLAVLDVPISNIDLSDVDELLQHALVLGEIKRDSKGAAEAKATQVEPMLDFAQDDVVALYWDDAEQRIHWREKKAGRRIRHEGPAHTLPQYGDKIAVRRLTFDDILPSDALLEVFKRIERVLHAASIGPETRYGVILQLLLAKLYDEHENETQSAKPLAFQDFRALGTAPAAAEREMNRLLQRATEYYQAYLPRAVEPKFAVSVDTLLDVVELLAPVKIIASSQDVVQTFYMYFARHLYKWDLAQFFTPVTVTDFIARVLAPKFGEHVKDPACGSADFLTSAFRLGVEHDKGFGSNIWGADNSENAVQVAVLNMLLNGDGKSSIAEEDSLVQVDAQAGQFAIVVCNPPFGTRIKERRKKVLANFALGHAWAVDEKRGELEATATIRDSQQVGILFAELCVRQAKPGGRIGIILPNGYLANRSEPYLALREWLLRHCRVASICSFPRFTFKTSGADVSASVLFLEKREMPIAYARDDAEYDFHVGLIEHVGWNLGDKGAKPVFRRDPSDGSYLTDESGNRVLRSDFSSCLNDMRSSAAAEQFRWMGYGPVVGESPGWAVSAAKVVEDPSLTLDPKRLSRKATELREELEGVKHYRLGDLVEFVPEGPAVKDSSGAYRYVQIDDMSSGTYRWTELRGWELPSRARHRAERGDLFIGAVWSSVGKWALVGGDDNGDLVVTNGCHRLRFKPGKAKYRLDVVAALTTEAYSAQMRALARGSDGLAEISVDDCATVLIPVIVDASVRAELEPFVDQLLAGVTSVKAKVDQLLASSKLTVPNPARRSTHTAQV